MTELTITEPVTHATFTVERRVRATPERVFRAWADKDAKARWFGGGLHEFTPEIREMDFRAGGTERVRGAWAHGMVSDFQARYLDIVTDRRIVYAYDLYVDERKISVSLATIQLIPDGDGTRLLVTEQGAYLGEGAPNGPSAAASREHGTRLMVDALARTVE